MKTPNFSHCLALTLPLWAAVLGWSTAALASHAARVPEVAFAMMALTTVTDHRCSTYASTTRAARTST
jgi:hypothetical protein